MIGEGGAWLAMSTAFQSLSPNIYRADCQTSRRIIAHSARNLTLFSNGLVVGNLELIEGSSRDSEAMPDALRDANRWFLQDDFGFLLQ